MTWPFPVIYALGFQFQKNSFKKRDILFTGLIFINFTKNTQRIMN
jgi:hypothetical protein